MGLKFKAETVERLIEAAQEASAHAPGSHRWSEVLVASITPLVDAEVVYTLAGSAPGVADLINSNQLAGGKARESIEGLLQSIVNDLPIGSALRARSVPGPGATDAVRSAVRRLSMASIVYSFKQSRDASSWTLLLAGRRTSTKLFGSSERHLLGMLHRFSLTYRDPVVTAPAVEGVSLPPRMQQVLDLLLEGLSEKAIAAQMGIKLSTVHTYVVALYTKLGVHSRAELLSTLLRPR
jgi:DNA-binding CsgD family transcriptional regulator